MPRWRARVRTRIQPDANAGTGSANRRDHRSASSLGGATTMAPAKSFFAFHGCRDGNRGACFQPIHPFLHRWARAELLGLKVRRDRGRRLLQEFA